MPTISSALKCLRALTDLRQEDAAERCGVEYHRWGYLEGGRSDNGDRLLQDLRRIAEGLGVTLPYLVYLALHDQPPVEPHVVLDAGQLATGLEGGRRHVLEITQGLPATALVMDCYLERPGGSLVLLLAGPSQGGRLPIRGRHEQEKA
jgi:transcriptional regulator with XRE-family HTH domain